MEPKEMEMEMDRMGNDSEFRESKRMRHEHFPVEQEQSARPAQRSQAPTSAPPPPPPYNSGPKLYTVSRGDKLANTGTNYSHCHTLNSFWVDTPIYLEAIGFFGPFDKKPRTYSVALEIFKSFCPILDGNADLIWQKKSDGKCIHAKPKEIFRVSADKLFLYPGSWYHVRFILERPDTVTLKESSLDNVSAEVPVDPIGWGGREKVNFQFLRGSKQMPELVFSVVPKDVYEKMRIRWETGADGGCCCSIV